MPTVRGSGLIRDVASIPCADETLRQRGRYRRGAIGLLAREGLLEAAFCYRIVPLDAPPSDVLRVGGEALDALRLVPQSGRLTALGVGVLTLGPALERRASTLFEERRVSLALALDKLGNELLSALSRRVQDRIVIEARNAGLTAAGELRAGDPGLPLSAQSTVHRLAGAESIGVSVTPGQVLHPLKSMSMVLGIGIDLPAAHWSRCDDCPSAPRCRMSGRGAGYGLRRAP
jgi:hypothetical protein